MSKSPGKKSAASEGTQTRGSEGESPGQVMMALKSLVVNGELHLNWRRGGIM